MLRRLTAVQAFVVLLSVIGVSSASAQALDDSNVPGWRFSVTPYFWMAGLKGDVGAYSNLPASSIDVGFGDIFRHLDGPTAFVAGEAWNGRFGVLGDVQYLTIKANASTPGPLFGGATLKQWNFNSTIAGAYRVVDSPAVSVDALVGTRIFHVDNQIDLSGAILPPRSNSIGDTWATAVAGGRLTVPLPHGFLFTSYADVGGFGISSDWTWQIYGGVGYRFKDWLSAYAGYRYLDVRHRNGGFLYDVSEQGPLLSVRFSF
jgi:opacity protein-like surface antigen